MIKPKPCAGIVLYNPEIDRLSLNIDSIIDQVDQVILVDNGSKNLETVKEKFANHEKIVIVENGENLGVATALNIICNKAIIDGFNWAYLLDQDSVSSLTIINSYCDYIHKADDDISIMVPYIVDINVMTVDEYKELELPKFEVVEKAITSGSMINLNHFVELNGFRDELFIDWVDFDYSMKVEINRYKHIKLSNEFILHEIGHQEELKLKVPYYRNGKIKFKTFHRSNHSEFRLYYLSRNIIIFLRRYKKQLRIKRFMNILMNLLIKLLIERNIFRTSRVILKGIWDGMRFPIIEDEYSKKNKVM